MIWKILRPRFWMLARRLRQTNRFLVIGLVVSLGLVVQFLWNNFLRDKFALLPPEQMVGFIADFIPMMLFVLVGFTLLNVGDVMQQLYLASDLKLLMVAPIPLRTIFLTKLLLCSRANAIPVLLMGAIFYAMGFAQGAPLSYFLLIALLLLMGAALATAVVMLLVMLLARVLPARFVRVWMPIAISVIIFALLFSQSWMAQWFSTQTGFVEFMTRTSIHSGQLAFVTLGVGALALFACLFSYRVFNATFQEGWDRLREVPAFRKPISSTSARDRGIHRWKMHLPDPLRSFLFKDWLELRRDPQGLLNMAMAVMLILVFSLIPFINSGEARDTLQPLMFWFMLMIIGFYGGILPVGSNMMAVAREGRKLTLLRAAPVSMEDMLKGKFWVAWIPMTLLWLIVLFVSGCLLRLSAWQIGFLMGIAIWCWSGGSLSALSVAALKVDFEADELKARIPISASFVTMALNGALSLLTIGAGLWVIIRLLPESSVALVIRLMSGFTIVEWLLSDALWVPVVLVGSQVVYWIGVRLLWNTAVQRLQTWEVG